ncbi:cation/H(+) antiporter 15-like [Hibiscus syriacus]|uniref:cation/H(+) antiporter 15-like n=1 Tax=Hibiscus syriacus TaxID=106335 RepID=UPI001920D0BF|nr:cation/H(+) antiporter 15-like [Hibiscus syriacus]
MDPCWNVIPVTSEGLFNQKGDDNIFKHHLIILQLQLAIIFILATIFHLVLGLLYLPRLTSEVLAGIILGPSVLGRFFPNISSVLFPRQSVKVLTTLTRFGKSGKREWTIGSLVIVFPLLLGVHTATEISLNVDHIDEVYLERFALFTGVLMLTPFPVVAILLMHLKIINSELGLLTLSSALISDLISVVIVNLDKFVQLTRLGGFFFYRLAIPNHGKASYITWDNKIKIPKRAPS